MVGAIHKLIHVITETPLMKDIDHAIKQIDLDFDALRAAEIKLIKSCIVKLKNSETKFEILRVCKWTIVLTRHFLLLNKTVGYKSTCFLVLGQLANQTKDRTSSILRLIKKVNPDSDKLNLKIKILFKKFMNTMTVSLETLKKAENKVVLAILCHSCLS